MNASARGRPYQEALAKWFNKTYAPLMEKKGREAWPRMRALLAAS
jgi:hypothetical protein